MGRRVVLVIVLAGCGRFGFGGVDAPLPASCRDLPPGSPSGFYELELGPAYCEMDTAGGGWTRIADVDPAKGCPGEWTRVADPLVCAITNAPTGGGQRSAEFASPIPYAEVMGVARAYQYESPDAFGDSRPGIDGAYVDGMSITYRDSGARKHVWTYAVGWSNQNLLEPFHMCPCEAGGSVPPTFVSNSYLCASGHNDPMSRPDSFWYLDDPLYDGSSPGMGCDTGGRFVTTVAPPTQSPVEARLMMDQDSSNEDLGITEMQLFVR